MTQARPGDAGFTLVELLIALAILGLLTTGLATAAFVVLRTENSMAVGAALAHDQGLMAVSVVPDIQSALGVTSSSPGSGCPAGPNLLTLSWSETVTSTVSYLSVYAVTPQGGRWQLTRVQSANGVTQSTQIVAHSLVSATAGTVTCSGTANRSVTLSVTEPSGIAAGTAVASVAASRRGP